MDAKELANRYQTALKKSGLLAEIDKDGDVIFKHPDLGSFYFSIDERDPAYMMLVFPNFTNKDLTGGDRGKLLELVNKVNGINKAVKLVVRGTPEANVSANIECFLAMQGEMPAQDLLDSVVGRNLAALGSAIKSLIKASGRGGDADEQSSA